MDGVFAKIASVQDLVDKHDEDEDAAKVIGHLFKIAQVLLHQYPTHMSSNLDEGLKKVSDWTRKYGESSATTDPNVLKPFLNLLFDANRMFKPNSGLHLDIAREIHSKLGDLNETLQVRYIYLRWILMVSKKQRGKLNSVSARNLATDFYISK